MPVFNLLRRCKKSISSLQDHLYFSPQTARGIFPFPFRPIMRLFSKMTERGVLCGKALKCS